MRVTRTISSDFDDEAVRIMQEAKREASMSICDRSRFGCVIVGFKETPDEIKKMMVQAHNEPPIPNTGLCGKDHCIRNPRSRQQNGGLDRGTELSLSCVHAEAIARWKYIKAGLQQPATVYLYGDTGLSLPCPTCLKEFIHMGLTKFWLAGRRDVFYELDPPLPPEWVGVVEYGIIPDHYLGDD